MCEKRTLRKLSILLHFFHISVFDKVNKESGKNEMYVVVALGSRDRSFSVWTTSLKRPFFVINDAFDQGVLDMSWSRDGKIFLFFNILECDMFDYFALSRLFSLLRHYLAVRKSHFQKIVKMSWFINHEILEKKSPNCILLSRKIIL